MEVDSFKLVDIRKIKIPMIVVYYKPVDYPGKCVARLFNGRFPTDKVIVRDTIEEVRGDIKAAFPYMVPFIRDEEDALSIVETWI